jgi:hypothetical protein
MRCAVKSISPSDERSAGNRHATFCGSRGRFVAPGDPVGGPYGPPLLGNAPLLHEGRQLAAGDGYLILSLEDVEDVQD